MTTECTRTAPKTIYLNIFCETDAPFPQNTEDITWCDHDVGDNDVCYKRADIAAAEIARLQAQVDALAGALKTALPYINADVNEPGGPVALAVSALAAVGR